MKYLLLIYSNPATWDAMSDQQRRQLMTEADAIMKEFHDAGEWAAAADLAVVRGTNAAITDIVV